MKNPNLLEYWHEKINRPNLLYDFKMLQYYDVNLEHINWTFFMTPWILGNKFVYSCVFLVQIQAFIRLHLLALLA